MRKKVSRKQFFKIFPGEFLGGFREEEDDPENAENPDGSGENGQAHKKEPVYVRPPGAVRPDKLFFKLCERCGKCNEACPVDAIFFHGPREGIAEGVPYLDAEQKPCRWCSDFPCINACPSGALRLGAEGAVAPVAKANIDPERCSVSMGMICELCLTSCPSSIRAIRLDANRAPVLNAELCTGCGQCVYYCDAAEKAISLRTRI